MQAKDIKVGKWYETRVGTGECLDNVRRYPAAYKFNLHGPIFRGFYMVVPRDVLYEVPPGVVMTHAPCVPSQEDVDPCPHNGDGDDADPATEDN